MIPRRRESGFLTILEAQILEKGPKPTRLFIRGFRGEPSHLQGWLEFRCGCQVQDVFVPKPGVSFAEVVPGPALTKLLEEKTLKIDDLTCTVTIAERSDKFRSVEVERVLDKDIGGTILGVIDGRVVAASITDAVVEQLLVFIADAYTESKLASKIREHMGTLHELLKDVEFRDQACSLLTGIVSYAEWLPNPSNRDPDSESNTPVSIHDIKDIDINILKLQPA